MERILIHTVQTLDIENKKISFNKTFVLSLHFILTIAVTREYHYICYVNSSLESYLIWGHPKH
jgi:hypothetical protein